MCVSSSFQHGRKQRVFVLAVAVLIVHNGFRRVWLITSDAEGYTDVAHLSGDIIVDGMNLLIIGSFAFDQLVYLHAAQVLQRCGLSPIRRTMRPLLPSF